MSTRKTIIYTPKPRVRTVYAEMTAGDNMYIHNLLLAFFMMQENNTAFLTSLLKPAHLGKTNDAGTERQKHWIDFLAGMLAKSMKVNFPPTTINPDGSKTVHKEDFAVQQLEWLNKLLAHVGEQKLNLVQSDEDLFQFGRAA